MKTQNKFHTAELHHYDHYYPTMSMKKVRFSHSGHCHDSLSPQLSNRTADPCGTEFSLSLHSVSNGKGPRVFPIAVAIPRTNQLSTDPTANRKPVIVPISPPNCTDALSSRSEKKTIKTDFPIHFHNMHTKPHKYTCTLAAAPPVSVRDHVHP